MKCNCCNKTKIYFTRNFYLICSNSDLNLTYRNSNLYSKTNPKYLTPAQTLTQTLIRTRRKANKKMCETIFLILVLFFLTQKFLEKESLSNDNCDYIFVHQVTLAKRQRRDLSVFESSCHLPTCYYTS